MKRRLCLGSTFMCSLTTLPFEPSHGVLYRGANKSSVFVRAGPLTRWGSLASNGRALHLFSACFQLDRLRRSEHPGHGRSARHAEKPAGRDVAWEVMTEVDTRQRHAGRQREDEWGGMRIEGRERRGGGE